MKGAIAALVAIVFILWMPYAGQVAEMSPAALINPYAGAPACATHNDRRFHGLWNYTLGCHYDHIHGDNPHTVDDIFGTGYYTIAGGEISYPWQTPSENELKHEAYKWIVRRDLPCIDDLADGCITAFRTQVHADMFNVVSDYHSFAIEMQVCLEAQPTNCGIIRWGGWQFVGDMTIDDMKVYDRQEPPNIPPDFRVEQIHQASRGDARIASWYLINPGPALVRVVHRTQDNWGFYPLPATRPITTPFSINQLQFFCEVDAQTGQAAPDCYTNGSRISPDNIRINPGNIRSIIDADNNLVADYNGYVDRYGAIVSGCTAVSLDCIPIAFEHVPLPLGIFFRYFVPAIDLSQTRDYDIYFSGHPSGWIRFPS